MTHRDALSTTRGAHTPAGRLVVTTLFSHDIQLYQKLLPVMKGEPHGIHTPASIPKHWEDEVRAQLDEDINKASSNLSLWCAHMVVVAKKHGKS